MKKTVFTLTFFLFIIRISFSQSYFKPGFSGVYLQQIGIFGFKISQDFTIKNKNNCFDFGVDFILGKGNKNIDFKKYDNYSFEYTNYSPLLPGLFGIPAVQIDMPTGVLPKTSSSKIFSIKAGYLRSFKVFRRNFKLGGGFYAAYVDSHYFIGTYEDESVIYSFYNQPLYFDVAFFVSLRYINFGFYTKAEFEIFQNKKQPMNIELQYYWGDYHSGLWSLGVNVPFSLNKE
jgi:hypothetical protein